MSNTEDGGIYLSIRVNDVLKQCTYYGYSEREARNKFYKEYVKG